MKKILSCFYLVYLRFFPIVNKKPLRSLRFITDKLFYQVGNTTLHGYSREICFLLSFGSICWTNGLKIQAVSPIWSVHFISTWTWLHDPFYGSCGSGPGTAPNEIQWIIMMNLILHMIHKIGLLQDLTQQYLLLNLQAIGEFALLFLLTSRFLHND